MLHLALGNSSLPDSSAEGKRSASSTCTKLWIPLPVADCHHNLQALCFMAGANSIFDGDKLLTTPNNERSDDMEMFATLGLRSRPAFMHENQRGEIVAAA